MHNEWKNGEWLVSTDPAKLDAAAIHAFLTRSYWAKDIPLEIVERSLRHSLCFGLFDGNTQIGLARVISDFATFAYLADVYVLENYRGRGLGKWLISCVVQHPQLQSLRKMLLITHDAHGLYRPFGFEVTKNPENFMEIRKPGLYKKLETK